MTFTVVWGVDALAGLRRLRSADALGAAAVAAAVRGLVTNVRSDDSSRFGETEFYRLRTGDYRILYEVDDQACAIHILTVGRVPPGS